MQGTATNHTAPKITLPLGCDALRVGNVSITLPSAIPAWVDGNAARLQAFVQLTNGSLSSRACSHVAGEAKAGATLAFDCGGIKGKAVVLETSHAPINICYANVLAHVNATKRTALASRLEKLPIKVTQAWVGDSGVFVQGRGDEKHEPRRKGRG